MLIQVAEAELGNKLCRVGVGGVKLRLTKPASRAGAGAWLWLSLAIHSFLKIESISKQGKQIVLNFVKYI